MYKYLCTVIVPVYNTEPRILSRFEESIGDIPSDVQVIIVDDGSKKETADALDLLLRPNLFVYHKENGGVSSARNYALERAEGEYILFADSDDCIKNGFFTDFPKKAKENNLDVFYSDITVMPKNITDSTGFKKNEIMNGPDFIKCNPNPFKSFDFCYSVRACFKKELLDKFCIRFNENMTVSEDMVFNLNALRHSERVMASDKSYYEYWLDTENSATRAEYINGYLESLAVEYEECKKIACTEALKKLLAEFYMDFAFYNLVKNQKKGGKLSYAEYIALCELPMFRESIVILGKNHKCENLKADILYRLRRMRKYKLPYRVAVK